MNPSGFKKNPVNPKKPTELWFFDAFLMLPTDSPFLLIPDKSPQCLQEDLPCQVIRGGLEGEE